MKKCFTILNIFFAFSLFGEAEETAVTNLLIASDTIESRGWTRQHVMAGADNKPVNDQGKLAAYADMIALSNAADAITAQAVVISNAMFDAIDGLLDVTNRIPAKATHIALYLPRLNASANLAGEVISESSDGITDTQIVRYNQRLLLAPNRSVEYIYNDVTTRVSVAWAEPWDTNALEHVCTIRRPSHVRNVRALTYRHERFGGATGFDFGSALVLVNGMPAFTGIITNAATGAEMEFRNGIYKNIAKELSK